MNRRKKSRRIWCATIKLPVLGGRIRSCHSPPEKSKFAADAVSILGFHRILRHTKPAGCPEVYGEMPFPECESASRPPHSSGDTPQRPDAGQGRLGQHGRNRPPLRCSAPTAAPANRCGRRRLGYALTAASGDSSSEHDHSPGSLPVAGSPVATPEALPRSHRRRLLPPLRSVAFAPLPRLRADRPRSTRAVTLRRRWAAGARSRCTARASVVCVAYPLWAASF